MIFTKDQAALIRQGKLTAALVPTTSKIKPNRTRPLRRRITRHDADGTSIGQVTETVEDIRPDGDRKRVILTILSVTETPIVELTLADAKACGYQTLIGLTDAWRAQHPRADRVKLVRFTIGDVRDIDRYIGWTGRAGGDYVSNPRRAADEAAALSEQDLAAMTVVVRARDEKRLRHPDQVLRDNLVRALERYDLESGGFTSRDRARPIQGIRRQIAVLDRKLKAA